MGIIQMTEVQTELGITDEQKKEIQDLLEKNRPQFGGGAGRGGPGGPGGGDNAEAQQRREEMAKRMQEMEKNVAEGLAKILKPEQIARMGELRLQREGVNAFARTEIADKLGLTDEQKDKLRKIQADSRAAVTGGGGNFFDMSEEERQQAVAKMQEQRKKTEEAMIGVLTDEQKTKLTEMKGKEFKFPEGRGGFGGGGQGGERRRPERKKAV